MALSFSQGLLSSLTDPSFGGNLGVIGQQIGGLGGQLRANEQAEAEKKRMAQMAALEASGQGATEAAAQNRVNFQRSLLGDLGSTVSPELAAIQQGAALQAGVKPADVAAARQLSVSPAQQAAAVKRTKGMEAIKTIAAREDLGNENVKKSLYSIAAQSDIPFSEVDSILSGTTKEGNQFTLGSGDIRFDAAGNVIARGPEEPEKQQGPMTATLQKRLGAASDAANEFDILGIQIGDLATALDSSDFGGGLVSDAKEFLKRGLGIRDLDSQLRTQSLKLRNSETMKALPPGTASDADVALALQGVPPNNATAAEFASFLRGTAKLAKIGAEYNDFKASYISQNGTERGLRETWKAMQDTPPPVAPPAAVQFLQQNPSPANLSAFVEKYGYAPRERGEVQ